MSALRAQRFCRICALGWKPDWTRTKSPGMAKRDGFLTALLLSATLMTTPRVHGIMAGDETALPADSPAARLDTLGSSSAFNTVGSLAINLESLIGPGDSGGPLLLFDGSGYSIAGVNTFTEGYGGRFGDIGGGIVLAPYLDWIGNTTGLAIPEPSVCWLVSLGLAVLVSRRRDAAE